MRAAQRRHFTIISVAVILFSLVLASETLSKDSCDDKLLPEQLRQFLKKKFPSWKVLTLSDLHPENKRTWLDGKHRAGCPGIAVGHFESKEHISYAVALIPLNIDQPSFQLVVVNRVKGSYQLRVLVEPRYPNNYYVIYKVPPGKYSDPEGVESVQLKLDGFQMEQMDVGAILFYWKNGRYLIHIVDD